MVGGLLSVSPPEEHLERRTFADVAAIQERVTAVLRSILKEAFADSFQKLYERCQQCVVKDGDYFEGQYS
jgi:methylmalonyl-CoA mutase cobalamin-binding subunit